MVSKSQKRGKVAAGSPGLDRLLANEEFRAAYEQRIAANRVASLLRDARETTGLTQRDLAARIGSAQSDIARIERGDSAKGPTVDTLSRIVHALGGTLELRIVLEGKKADGARPRGRAKSGAGRKVESSTGRSRQRLIARF